MASNPPETYHTFLSIDENQPAYKVATLYDHAENDNAETHSTLTVYPKHFAGGENSNGFVTVRGIKSILNGGPDWNPVSDSAAVKVERGFKYIIKKNEGNPTPYENSTIQNLIDSQKDQGDLYHRVQVSCDADFAIWLDVCENKNATYVLDGTSCDKPSTSDPNNEKCWSKRKAVCNKSNTDLRQKSQADVKVGANVCRKWCIDNWCDCQVAVTEYCKTNSSDSTICNTGKVCSSASTSTPAPAPAPSPSPSPSKNDSSDDDSSDDSKFDITKTPNLMVLGILGGGGISMSCMVCCCVMIAVVAILFMMNSSGGAGSGGLNNF